MSLQNFKDKLSMDLYRKTTKEAVDSGNCIQCGLPAMQRCYSDDGRREFHISGLCEVCFDEICLSVEDETSDAAI
jgi:hypothetical protein